MITHRIRKSVLAGVLTLSVLGSQSMEILTASAASEDLEYEGTTQISSVDYYPAFDTMSTALTVEEVYVEAGSSVQEGDAILKLTEDSYQSALDYYQAAILRATNDLINEELAYAQGMQSAEYDLELALASEEQAEFVQQQSEAELSDTIDEHEEVLTEMEERIEELENGEYDSEEEAEEAMSASGMSGTDASASGMSGANASGGGMSGADNDSLDSTDKNLNKQNKEETESEESQGFEERIEGLKKEAQDLEDSLKDYRKTLETYPEADSALRSKIDGANSAYEDTLSEIKDKIEVYSPILSDISDLLNLLEEADLEWTSYSNTQSSIELAEETYQEPEVIEEPQIEEPQIEEPQIEEPQVEEPQIEEPQPDEPEEIFGEEEAADSFEENSGSEESEGEGTEDETENETETETETEEWDGMFDPEHPEKGGLLIVQISGGTITLEIPENAFTEAVSLQVSELTASYEALISGAVDAEDTSLLYAVLNNAYESREGSWDDTNDQIYDFYVLNLSFVNQDGAVVEPAAAIQVTVDHSAAPVNVGAAEADMGRTREDLYRIAGGVAVAVGSQISLINNGISSLSFTADSFSSPFVVLMIGAAKEEETETESESVTEDEEVLDETEKLINMLDAEEGNDEGEEGIVSKLITALDEILYDLGDDNEGIQLKEFRDQLEKEGVSVGLLIELKRQFSQLKTEGKGGESLDKAMELLNKLEEDELEKYVLDLIDQLQTEGYKPEELLELLSTSESNLYEYYQEYYDNTTQNWNKAKKDFINIQESIIDLVRNLEELIADMGQQTEKQEGATRDGFALEETVEQEEAMEAAEDATSELTDEMDLSALAGMSGMDASSMANMSDTEAMQMAEEELAADWGESAASGESVLDVQSILSAQESESLFGDKYDLTQAKALLERKATDADEAEELLDDLYPMQESVQLDYEELLRLRKPLRLEIQYQYDETLLLARMAEITYDQTTKELEEELKAALENLTDLEEKYQELENLEDGTVRAAASGTLSAVYYEAEDTLFAVYPMYSIYDTDTVTVLIAVPQSEIAQIAVGEEVEVSLSSFGTTQGTVTEKAVEPQEGNSRTTVNYEVEVSIDNSSGRLSSGTAATVSVTEA